MKHYKNHKKIQNNKIKIITKKKIDFNLHWLHNGPKHTETFQGNAENKKLTMSDAFQPESESDCEVVCGDGLITIEDLLNPNLVDQLRRMLQLCIHHFQRLIKPR